MTETATCRTCGTEPRAGARYCDACGAPVTSTPGAEYKQVTVLFADVVRSMDIAATLGAERLREIMSDLFNHSASVVRRSPRCAELSLAQVRLTGCSGPASSAWMVRTMSS